MKYVPGELKVAAWKDGKPWTTSSMKTTGPVAKLLLTPDRASITADGKDLSFVTARIATLDIATLGLGAASAFALPTGRRTSATATI